MKSGLILFLMLAFAVSESSAGALSAQQILEKHAQRPSPDSFRICVLVKNVKRKKVSSEHILWIIGKKEADFTSMFIDFEEPADAKGMRFLFFLPEDGSKQRTRAFGYLPATRVAAPLKVGKRSVQIGGTGLTIEDLRGFTLSKNQPVKLIGEEKVGEFECYVLSLKNEQTTSEKKAWISKEEFLLVKSQELDSKGNVQREFLVKDFFTTLQGEKWARREQVTLPKEGVKISVEQIAGVSDITIPEEIFSPKKFGPYVWRTLK